MVIELRQETNVSNSVRDYIFLDDGTPKERTLKNEVVITRIESDVIAIGYLDLPHCSICAEYKGNKGKPDITIKATASAFVFNKEEKINNRTYKVYATGIEHGRSYYSLTIWVSMGKKPKLVKGKLMKISRANIARDWRCPKVLIDTSIGKNGTIKEYNDRI